MSRTRSLIIVIAAMPLLVLLLVYLNMWLGQGLGVFNNHVITLWGKSILLTVETSPTLATVIGRGILPFLVMVQVYSVFALNFLLGMTFRAMSFSLLLIATAAYLLLSIQIMTVIVTQILSGHMQPNLSSLLPLVLVPAGLLLGNVFANLAFRGRLTN